MVELDSQTGTLRKEEDYRRNPNYAEGRSLPKSARSMVRPKETTLRPARIPKEAGFSSFAPQA